VVRNWRSVVDICATSGYPVCMDDDLLYEICGIYPTAHHLLVGDDEVLVLDNGDVVIIG
jgi:hypothetical protein